MGLGLPVIVDIAISLVFTFFTLSLLASEAQNLLKTLLQWRAVHLKESIEGLLVGNDSDQSEEARALANQLYANPLIRSLSHQTKKGGVADAVRTPLRLVTKAGKNPVFGDQEGGPSKIPPAAFSSSLLSTFDFVSIYRQLVAFRLEVNLKNMIPDQAAYQEQLAGEVDVILASFKSKQITLAIAVKEIAADAAVDKDIFDPELFERYFGSDEAIGRFADKMQLSLADTIRSVRQYLQLTKDNLGLLTKALGDNPTFEQAQETLITLQEQNPEIKDLLPPSTDQAFLAIALILTSPELQDVIQALPPIPPALGDNLERLADSALGKIEDFAQEAAQFEQEISGWFDNSMERAKGVYVRNSKLIALILSFAIAITANADTFYMIDRFAKEKTITASVIETVDQLPQDVLGQEDRINELSSQLSLPMGWDPVTLKNQSHIRIIPLPFVPFIVQRIPGWSVTGFAVSMGASFWYDLLKKLLNVKKAGQGTPSGAAPVVAAPVPTGPKSSLAAVKEASATESE